MSTTPGAQYGGTDLGIPGIDSVTELARSAATTTYRVRDTATGRPVVVKVLNAGNFNAATADRFDREQRAIEGLRQHPNLVSVYGHGFTAAGQPYVVSEEVVGGNIAQRLRGSQPMQGPDILDLGVRMAGALESAHRAGVVHGDLRAEDIMLTVTGEPLLADFGVVSATGITPDRTDDPRRLAHVAPEVLQGRGVSPASDVYSLGSILYSLLAGETAFVSAADSTLIPVITRIASAPVPVPDLRAKGVPDPAADTMEKAMAKDPAQRPTSAREFGRLLQQVQVTLRLSVTEMTVLGPVAGPAGPPAAAAAPATAPPAPPYPPPGPPPGPSMPAGPVQPFVPGGGPPPVGAPAARSPNRLPWILGGAGVVLLLLIGGLALALRDGDDPVPAPDTVDDGEEAVELDPVRDDTEVIEVEVPVDWEDVDGAPFDNGIPNVQAATDRSAFLDGYETSGIDFTAFQGDDPNANFDPANTDEMAGLLDGAGDVDTGRGETFGEACDEPEREDFDAGGFEGFADVYSNCGEDDSEVVVVAAGDGSAGITVVMILTDDDERLARDDILDSFEVTF